MSSVEAILNLRLPLETQQFLGINIPHLTGADNGPGSARRGQVDGAFRIKSDHSNLSSLITLPTSLSSLAWGFVL